MSDTIDRDAGSKSKGFRLQRLRAVQLLLEKIQGGAEGVQCAIETVGDVHLAATDGHNYVEENKNYAAKGFTVATKAIRNTLVAFIDTYIGLHFSPNIKFSIFATPEVAKERNDGIIKKLGLSLPDEPVLELLSLKPDQWPPEVLPLVKSLILEEYERQYSKKSSPTGHLPTLQGWSDDDWTAFLSQVEWQLAESDARGTEAKALAAVAGSPFFSATLEGKEPLILAGLTDLFDRKQANADWARRYLTEADVEVVYLRAATGHLMLEDPTAELWDALEEPTDTRNLPQKLQSVCPSLQDRRLGGYSRKVSQALSEARRFSYDTSVRAVRYHIYDACEDYLARTPERDSSFDPDELDELIEDLCSAATARVAECAKSFSYRLNNEHSIRAFVLELLDSCFLALDGGEP